MGRHKKSLEVSFAESRANVIGFHIKEAIEDAWSQGFKTAQELTEDTIFIEEYDSYYTPSEELLKSFKEMAKAEFEAVMNGEKENTPDDERVS